MTKTPIDQSTIDRVTGKQPNLVQRLIAGAVRYALPTEVLTAWNSPGQILPPVAQAEEGRLFDFPTGVNTQSRPRTGEQFSFDTLRRLADGYDLMRIVIERRKDQIEALKFKFVTDDTTDNDKIDPRVKLLTEFFRKPDRTNFWGPWLRMVVEEMLVTDALTLYPRVTNGGQLFSLDVMDGGTIKVIVDDKGRRPIAPLPAYQQYVKGVPMATYSSDEIMYLPRNPRANRFYGYSPVEQVIMTVNIALRRQTHQLNYYTEGNIPEAFIPVPESWTPKNIRDFQKIWDSMMSSDMKEKRKAKFIPNVKNVIFTREPDLKDQMDDWLARVICLCFQYPPSALTQTTNRATAQTAQQTAEDEGLVPIMQTLKNIVDDIVVTRFGFTDIKFTWDIEKSLDPVVQSTVHKTDIESGKITVDEARVEAGMQPYGIKGQTDVPVFLREPTPAQAAAALAATAALNGNPEPNPPLPGKGTPGEGAPLAADGKGGTPPVNKEGGNKGANDKPLTKSAGQYASQDVMDQQRRDLVTKAETETTAILSASLQGALASILKQWKDSPYGNMEKAAKQSTYDAALTDFIDSLEIDLSGSSRAVGAALDAVATDGVRIAMAKIDGTTAPELKLANTRAGKYAIKRAAELITKDGGGGELTEATRRMIAATIAEAAESGATNEAVAKALQASYAFSPERALTIAQTELRAADVAGNLEAYKAAGVVTGKSWLLSNDENICPTCQGNADQGVIPLTDSFESGDQGPPAHPRCRCDIAPEV